MNILKTVTAELNKLNNVADNDVGKKSLSMINCVQNLILLRHQALVNYVCKQNHNTTQYDCETKS